MLLGSSSRLALDLQDCAGFSMPRGAAALPCATRPPATARACHARPARQPSVSSAKERARPPNSGSGERRETSARVRVGQSPGLRGVAPEGRGFHRFLAALVCGGSFSVSAFGVPFVWKALFRGWYIIIPPRVYFFSIPRICFVVRTCCRYRVMLYRCIVPGTLRTCGRYCTGTGYARVHGQQYVQ